jgi:hypothetical protein
MPMPITTVRKHHLFSGTGLQPSVQGQVKRDAFYSFDIMAFCANKLFQ